MTIHNDNDRPFEVLDLATPFIEPRYPHGHRWGPWSLDTNRLVLVLPRDHRGRGYEVDIERIDTAWDLLDWSIQVAQKGWCDAETAGHLLQALNELFLPQRRMRDGNHMPARQRLADKLI